MAEGNTVVVHGMWASPFAKRVELALKIKGIPYEYVEEDLRNKSPTLLKINPVHKKVPVLVHNETPITESFVILEYIDEVWKSAPRLLPEDPYRRAQIRFWADFIQKQLFEGMLTVVKTDGEAQEKAIKELKEKMGVLEDRLKDFLPEGGRFVGGDEMGFLDIVMVTASGGYEVQDEALGVKIIEEEKYPGVFSWLRSLCEHPLVKEVRAPREKLVELLQFIRQSALQSPAV